MIDAYRIGVSLVLDQSRVLTPLGEIMQAMERLDERQKDAQAGIDKMAAGYRAAARAAREMAEAVDRVSRAQAAAGRSSSQALVGSPSLSATPTPTQAMITAASISATPRAAIAGPGFSMMPGGPGTALVPAGPGRQWDVAGPSPDRGSLMPYVPLGGGLGASRGADAELTAEQRARFLSGRPEQSRGAFPMNDAMVAGAGAGAVGYGGFEVLRKIFDAGLDIGATQSNLLTQGFTTQDVATALASAKATQRGTIGSSVGGNLEIVSMLMAMTQDAGAAIRLMPGYAQLAVALNASGHGGRQIGELTAAMTGAELRGVLYSKNAAGQEVLDERGLSLFLKENLAASTMTHGRIGPKELTQFLKSGGIGASMLTDQALFADALPLIMAMGPARAGTALSGFSQQFSAGKMSEAGMNLLADMGLIIDKTKARKVGMGQFMLLPGAMRQGDVQLSRDAPATFIMDRLLPQIDKYLVKNFGPVFTGADTAHRTQMEMAEFQQVASRIPGGMEMAETLRNNPLIFRDRAAQRASMQRDAFATQAANNPKVAVEGLNASMQGLLVSLASPNMKTGTSALSDLTHGLNWLSEAIDRHPERTRLLVDFATGLTVVSAAVSAAMLSIVPAVAAAKVMRYLAGPGAAAKIPDGMPSIIPKAAPGMWGKLFGGAGTFYTAFEEGKEDFFNAAKKDANGYYPINTGLSHDVQNLAHMVSDLLHGKAQGPLPPASITLEATIHNYNSDGKRTSTNKVSMAPGVQSGTTGHDPRMGLYPAGAVAGSGQ